MSIVPTERLRHDPQTLLYQFPSIPAVRFQRLSRDYYFWKLVQIAERIAAITSRLLVPRECLHWQRKQQFRDRQVMVLKSSFYVLSEAEMTKTELAKYQAAIGGSHGESTD